MTVAGWVSRVLVVLGFCVLLTLSGQAGASAHPLGNFTVNHYNGLTLYPDRVDLLAVVDSAEIPTVQEKPAIDTDGDGVVGPAEAKAYAKPQCDGLADAVAVAVGGRELTWRLTASTLEFPPGEAGLATTRLTCRLSAPAALDGPATIQVRDSFRPDRIGWHEMTAVGKGVALIDSPVPTSSISGVLRSYPDDLLADPLDVREASLRTEPGSSTTEILGTEPQPGMLDRVVATATAAFTDLAGSEDLTPTVGLLALLLSVVLGASHAVLPGHGKTLIAAYLAGKRGSTRDALVVGATVTVTHTAGVLVLGLLISGSSALAGEDVLRWLGVISGVLVMGIGLWLLRSALRDRRATRLGAPAAEVALVGSGPAAHTHSHSHGHSHTHGHSHSHGHTHSHGRPVGRGGLIGMGVAGGLVPSPSALVVLLGAVALGRTWFGVLLVVGYGFGMAATLTAVGLLLVRLRDRLETSRRLDRLRDRIGVYTAWLPVLTAALVLVVGLGLAIRAATGNG